LERLKEIVARIQSFGNFHQHLDLIAGLPYEDYDTFRKSFDEIYALQPNQLQMGFLKVLKGSYMYAHAKEYEILYHDNPPYEVLATKWLSYEDVLKMKRVEEMLEVYYNSGQFTMTMQILELKFKSPFEMFLKVGEYYEENGLFFLNHSRIRRSEILLEFVKEQDLEHIELYKETLTFDLYYRENMKSRPGWAKDANLFKDVAKKLLERENIQGKGKKQYHVELFSYDFSGLTQETSPQPELTVRFSQDKTLTLELSVVISRFPGTSLSTTTFPPVLLSK